MGVDRTSQGSRNTGAGLPQLGSLLGLAQVLCREETVGVTPSNNTKYLRLGSPCEGFGGGVVLKFLHIVRFPVIRCVPDAGLQSGRSELMLPLREIQLKNKLNSSDGKF
jgi:hypothetical protein